MRLIRTSFLSRGLSLKEELAVDWLGVTIGNFDGMHLGHQALFRSLAESKPKDRNAATVLLSFVPHPRVYFASLKHQQVKRDSSFYRVNSFRERFALAKSFNFDVLFLARFNNSLAEMTAERFVEHFIVEGLAADSVVVGDDWRFGKARSGSSELLTQFGSKFGFSVTTVGEHSLSGQRVSTSKVKEAILAGNLSLVEKLQDRSYTMIGKVKRGEMRGHKIGFPTANIYPREKVLPKFGVYAVLVKTPYGEFKAVSNVGIRPTFSGTIPNVETHIFADQQLDLYDKYITLKFVARIRDEMKFSSIQDLSQQIQLDCQKAKELLR